MSGFCGWNSAIVLWCCCSLAFAQHPPSRENGSGDRPDYPAQRIIAISPHLAELVHVAGAGELLIATVKGADFPDQVRDLPTVGDASGIDFERMLQLAPDLVLGWGSGNRPADIARIRDSGVRVEVFEARRLDDIAQHLRRIGHLVGRTQSADAAATRFRNQLGALRMRFSSAHSVSVFVEIWHQPVFTVGPEHLLNEVLRVCGARNALSDYPMLAGPVPLENVLKARPDVVLTLSGQTESDASARWRDAMPADLAGDITVIAVAPDLLTRPGPRILAGVEQLCETFQRRRTARWSSPPQNNPVTSLQ